MMDDGAHRGPVDIRVPPDPSLSRLLRLAASGLASLGAFTVDEIEDIKVAVSEVLLALIEHGGGETIDIRFTTNGRSFVVLAGTATDTFDTTNPDLVMCRTVLSGVCAEHRIDFTDGRAEIMASVAHATNE
jgi:anti-sigma regulatory factor (Ser/Thr protein kinase)